MPPKQGKTNGNSPRHYPNIAITGNPGVGKTSLSQRLAENVPSLKYLDFGKESIERGFTDGWDDELNCHVVDYERMADDLDDVISSGGYIIDWIHADFWPLNGSIDLVVTITCDNTILFDRYKARGYSQAKIDENLDSEIMGEIVEENHNYFSGKSTLITLKGDTEEDATDNLAKLAKWIEKWLRRSIAREKDDETAKDGTNPSMTRVSFDSDS